MKTLQVLASLLGNGTARGNNNGGQNYRYAVLTSTNISSPLNNWTALTTKSFNPDGTFDFTNAINPAARQLFYDVKVMP
jgi:hypothetical protein